VEVWPGYEEFAYRVELWGDEVEQLSIINPTSGEVIRREEQLFVYPAKHFVMPEERMEGAVANIRAELEERLEILRSTGKRWKRSG
jgi:excinuclease ABC subunit B